MSSSAMDGARASIDRLVGAARARLRITRSVGVLQSWGLVAGLGIAAITIVLVRRAEAPLAATWLAVVPVVAGLTWANATLPARRRVLRHVDETHRLHDLIGNADELAAGHEPGATTSDLVALQLERAAAATSSIDLTRVFPMPRVRLRAIDVAAAVLFAIALLIPRVGPAPSWTGLIAAVAGAPVAAPGNTEKPPTLLVGSEPLRQDLRALVEGDDPAARIAESIEAVLGALERGELDRTEALAQLDALETELARAELELDAEAEADASLLGEALRELSQALDVDPLLAELADAIDRGDAKAVEEALADAEAAAEAAGEEGREALDRALKDAERSLAASASESRDTAAELAEAERRLKKQEREPAEDPEERERRLKKQQEQVDRLRKQHEAEMKAQEELERLRKAARDAQSKSADGSRRESQPQDGSDPSGAQQGRKQGRTSGLGEGLSEATRKTAKARRMGAARDALDDAKSAVRRASQGDGGDGREGQKERFARAAKGAGKDGKDGKGGKGGKDGKGDQGTSTLLVEGELGDSQPDMTLLGDGDGEGQPGEGVGEPGAAGDEGEPGTPGAGMSGAEGLPGAGQGDGIGQGSEEALGAEDGQRVAAKDVRVDASGRRGASRAEVIRESSQSGFASESYRDVYQDYRAFAQSALDTESLPPAMRRRVKRYFQMIQPRD